MEFILVIGLSLAYISYQIIENSTSDFFQKEAKRMVEKNCEIDKNWNSRGRIYTKGLKYTKNKDNKIIPINQGKLIGLGRVK